MIQSPNRTDLDQLIQHESGRCISVLMPTHKAGRDVMQNSIRFKNLITKAIDCNREMGGNAELHSRLENLAKLEHDSNLWQHQSNGFALFVCEGFEQTWKLPAAPQDNVVIDDQFFIRPLVTAINSLTKTLTLALTWKNARLFKFDGYDVREIVDDVFPVAKRDLVPAPLREDRLQFSTQSTHGTIGTSGHAKATPMFHGQGSGEGGVEADRAKYLSQIAERLASVTYNTDSNLVLMATEEVVGEFEATTDVEIATVSHVSPDGLNDEQIKQRVIEISHSIAVRSTDEVCERLGTALANEMAATQLDKIVLAASAGRVETLLLSDEKVRLGRFNRDQQEVEFDENAETDLVNIAVHETLKTGGSVLQLNEGSLEAPVAAIYRY